MVLLATDFESAGPAELTSRTRRYLIHAFDLVVEENRPGQVPIRLELERAVTARDAIGRVRQVILDHAGIGHEHDRSDGGRHDADGHGNETDL
ncbi:hypothetical protein BVRB_028570, partial [Beta vulgaris subsp. vulgaris]